MVSESDHQTSNTKSPKKSSLNQTKARYLQVIQDLTKDQQGAFHDQLQNSNPHIKPISKSASSLDLCNGNNTSEVEETPDEIRQYVKQFKAEVEEKYTKSESNKHYQFPRLSVQQQKTPQYDELSSLESLDNVTRYDLNCQNIKRKYCLSKTHLIIGGTHNTNTNELLMNNNDTGLLAQFLHDIGQLDKQF